VTLTGTNVFKASKKNDTQPCLTALGIKLGYNTIWDARGSFNIETPTIESNECRKGGGGAISGAIIGALCCIICIVVIIYMVMKKKGGD